MPFPLTDDEKPIVEAHFRRRKRPWTEDACIAMLEPTASKSDAYMAVIALRDCGTMRAVPALQQALRHASKDVRCTAMLTIAHLARESATPLFAERLLDPACRDKGYAMSAIDDAADERAVPAVLAHFARNAARWRKGRLHDGTLLEGVMYLARHREGNAAVERFFEEILECWPALAAGQRVTLRQHVDWLRARTPPEADPGLVPGGSGDE